MINKMKQIQKYIIIILGFFLISCEDVIEMDLETSEPRLVIDASINWVKNTAGNEQKIKLSTTTGFYDATFPTVSGAQIIVTNSSNVVFNFVENSGSGEYFCTNFQPILGETYTLKVILNGQTYTATETMIGVPKIEDNISQNNNGGMAGDEMEIVYYYKDDASQQNNYLYYVKNPRVAYPEYSVENDLNTQGQMTPAYYFNKDLKPGDELDIRLSGISKRYYDYFKKLLNASNGNNGNPFATIPSSVRGNIANQTNSSNFAFGYFRLSEVDVRTYVIQ